MNNIDHITGVYCSAATRELLLRLEKYPHRLNFAKGVLEAQKVHFKHLKSILKPIPLETPTQIELSPGNVIQVTLFDANHCSGAVMFLFEGNGKAVLYTGDIRSEPWMVNSLLRNPLLIEYTSGLKTLDCIYLDTSNTSNVPFPTKVAGLKELLTKVAKYPSDIVFHFEAWTFGYEEVWMALSKALKSQIHVDTYKYKLYQSLHGTSNTASSNSSGPFLANEGPILTGYTCGNTPQDGCLTTNTDVRIHSCEKGMHCSVLNEKTVLIRPIIARAHGEAIPEVGIGGGRGDLNQHPDLVLDDKVPIDDIMSLFNDADEDVKDDVQKMFFAGLGPTGRSISLDGMNLDRDETDLSLSQMAKIMGQSMSRKRRDSQQAETFFHNGQEWPRVITFPYSRHSSYEELVDLVSAFRPKDVYPCTVNDNHWVQEGLSIARLFGDECMSDHFRHDREMDEKYPNRSQLVSLLYSETKDARPDRKIIRRDNGGHLRPFDINDNELSATSNHLDMTTSPIRINAATPGAESQSLRRKAIFDELGVDPKRVRLSNDSGSVPPHDTNTQDEPPLNYESSQGSSIDTPGSEEDSDTLNENTVPNAVFDVDDQVHRCMLCSSEMWGGENGFCTGCEDGPEDMPYFESIEFNDMGKRRPGIAIDEHADFELEGKQRFDIVGDYLEDDSSAYDTQDSDSNFSHEEYEKNSFIDDSPSETEEEAAAAADDSSLSDGEDAFERKYKTLETSHTVLATKYQQLDSDYRELRHEFGIYSDDEDDEDDDDHERDEDGVAVVNIPQPQVVTTEVIVSSSEEQSDGEEICPDRIRLRAEVFEAVSGISNRSWHDVSLVSTTDNHTHAEVEL